MQETKSIKAILSAEDANFTSTMDRAASRVKSFASRVKQGVGFGTFMAIGQKAVNTVTVGMKSMVSQMDQTNAAWTTFASNMKAAGHSTGEIEKAKKSMQEFASQSIYYSSEMAATYAQLDAVGIKGTTNLVKGFGGVAAAAQNPSQAMKTLSQQATQMAAKPQVAWQDFKLMLEQTPAGIAQVAKVMGMSTKELVASVQAGEVKTEDFFEAIRKIGGDANNELMKSATKYKTIGEAINGTSGYLMTKLAPAWSVVSKAAIKALGKVQGIIGKIDSDAVAKKVESGIRKAKEIFIEIKPALKAAGSMFLTFGKAVVSVLPTLAKLAPVLVPALVALKGFQKVKGATSFISTLAGGLKSLAAPSIQAAAAMTSSYDTLQMLQTGAVASGGKLGMLKTALTGLVSPAGIAVAAVGALSGVAYAWYSHMANIPGTMQNLTARLSESSSAADAATKSYEQLKKAEEEQINAGLLQTESIASQKAELDSLVDANGKVKKGYESRVQFLVDSISKATGVEMEYTNGVVEGYGKAGKAIDDYVAKKRAQIFLDGHAKSYEAAIEGQNKYVKSMQDAQRIIEGIQSGEIADKNGNKLLAAQAKYEKYSKLYQEAGNEIQNYDKAQEAFNDGHYDKVEQALSGHGQRLDEIRKKKGDALKKDNEQTRKELTALAQIYNEHSKDGGEAAKNALTSMQQELNESSAMLMGYTGVKDAVTKIAADADAAGVTVPKSVVDGIKSGQYLLPTTVDEMNSLVKFDKLAQNAGDAGKDTVEKLRAQMAAGTLPVGDAVNKLSQTAANNFEKISKKGADEGKKASDKTAEAFKTNAPQVQAGAGTMVGAAGKSFNKMPVKAKAAANKTTTEASKQVKSGIPKLSTAFSGFFKPAITSTKNVTKKVSAESGKIGKAVPKEVSKNNSKIGKSFDAPMRSLINKLVSSKGKAQSNGRNIGAGLAAGLWAALPGVAAAASAIAAQADKAVRAKAKIKSPSKVHAKNGRFIALGLAKGMIKSRKTVYKAGTVMAGAADDGVTDYLQIASPSKKGKQRGKQTTQGIIAGIKAGSKKIPKSVGKSLKAAFGSKMVSKLPVKLQKQIKKIIKKKKTWKSLSKKQIEKINAAIGKYKFSNKDLTNSIYEGFNANAGTAKKMLKSTFKKLKKTVSSWTFSDMATDKVDFRGAGDAAAKSFTEAYEAKSEKMRDSVTDKITASTNKLQVKYSNLAANASKKEAAARAKAKKYEKLAAKAKKNSTKKKYNKLAQKYNKIAEKYNKIAEANKTKAESVRSATDTIVSQFESAYNDMVSKAKESAQEQINAISEKYDKLYQELKQKRDNFYSKLSSHEGLFVKDDTAEAKAVYDSYGFLVKAAANASSAMKIVNFDEQTKQIKAYKANLDKLKKAGVSTAYLEEMTQNLSYTDGLEFTNKLLAEGTQKAIAYGKSYENMIGVANDLSNQWYKSDFESLQSQYSADIAKVEADLKKKLDSIAKNTLAGFKYSLQREIKKAKLGKVGTAMANKLIKAIKKKLGIKSPSKVMASIGSYTGEGFVKGLESSEKDVYKAMDNIITMPPIRRPEMKMAAGAELNSNYSYGSTIDGEIVVVTTIDGKVVAQTTAPYTEEILNKRQIRESRKQGRL